MKLKEMFKKIDAYNELAEIMGTEKVQLSLSIGYDNCKFDTYKSLTKYIRCEYVEGMAQALLECDKYEFDKDIYVETMLYGRPTSELVETYLSAK